MIQDFIKFLKKNEDNFITHILLFIIINSIQIY